MQSTRKQTWKILLQQWTFCVITIIDCYECYSPWLIPVDVVVFGGRELGGAFEPFGQRRWTTEFTTQPRGSLRCLLEGIRRSGVDYGHAGSGFRFRWVNLQVAQVLFHDAALVLVGAPVVYRWGNRCAWCQVVGSVFRAVRVREAGLNDGAGVGVEVDGSALTSGGGNLREGG